MQAFTQMTGIVVPLDRANVDTDAIIPKQFLKSIKRTGFGPNLFDEWRYLDRGEPGMDNAGRPVNGEFVLNQPRYAGGSILLARKNFGCGSSREHAPQALMRAGFQAFIGESFSEIFTGNCTALGLPVVTVSKETVEQLMDRIEAQPDTQVALDLVQKQITVGTETYALTIVESSRQALVSGQWDSTEVLLQNQDKIHACARRLAYIS